MSRGTPSQRQLRVGEEIRHAIVDILAHAHFHDPDLADVPVTVTEVRISPDLGNATVYVTGLGGAATEAVMAALNRASGYVRRELGRIIRLRHVPRLHFAADTAFSYSSKIEALLHHPEVLRDLAGPASRTPVEGEEDEDGAADRDGARPSSEAGTKAGASERSDDHGA